MATKEELQRQLAEIQQKEFEELIDANYPKFKALEGRFFREKNYFTKTSPWWKYTKVLSIPKENLYCGSHGQVLSTFSGWSFEIQDGGLVCIETQKNGYAHSLGEEISEKVFQKAWVETLGKLTSLDC